MRDQLKVWKKDNKSIDLYLQGAITRFDQFTILGKAMDHEDQINDIVLAGWPEEYESIVDQIEGRETSPTITELHEKLLNHEAKLLSAAVFLINRIPTPNLDNETPYQKLFQQAPNYNRLRVFGSFCFPWRRPCTKIKMEDRSKGCVFLGYSTLGYSTT